MNYFNYLPPELIVFIFDKLNLDDLINLKKVDKRFKEISEQIKIKELHVKKNIYDTNINREYNSFSKLWFYTNDLTYFDKKNIIPIERFDYDYENRIDNSQLQYYRLKLQLNKNLKRLSLCLDFSFDYLNLNEFKLLEHLSITINDCYTNSELNLENLKIFEIHREHAEDLLELILNTNKLFAFKSCNMQFKEFIFNYPDKILFYEIDHDHYDDKCIIFSNLKYFKLTHLNGPIDRNILSKFKKLKTLDLEGSYFTHEERWDNMINDINFIINQKENLNRPELQIYLNNIKLINQNKLNQLKPRFVDNLEFQIKNYDLLKDNCDKYQLNYCDLIKLIRIIPSSFVKKFPFIRVIKANQHIDDEDQFIKFLNNLSCLTELKLIDCELTKSFYKKSTDLIFLKNLESLEILTTSIQKDLKINFNFIVNLKRIRNFRTNQKINNINHIYKLFKINYNIRRFYFKINSKNYIQIIKNRFTSRIDSFYLDDNLEEVKNLSIDLKPKDLALRIKNLKFEL